MGDKKLVLSAESIGNLIDYFDSRPLYKETGKLVRELWKEYAHSLCRITELKETVYARNDKIVALKLQLSAVKALPRYCYGLGDSGRCIDADDLDKALEQGNDDD